MPSRSLRMLGKSYLSGLLQGSLWLGLSASANVLARWMLSHLGEIFGIVGGKEIRNSVPLSLRPLASKTFLKNLSINMLKY
jgi:hypothetical protein